MDLVVETLNNHFFQVLRTIGYLSTAASLYAIWLNDWHNAWRFRYVLMAVAIHMTIVSMWAALISADINVSGPTFNAILSFTTSVMIYGAVIGFLKR